ncbi:hypothetical protein BaRGS_00038571, partial [Batillaria attramentaria]
AKLTWNEAHVQCQQVNMTLASLGKDSTNYIKALSAASWFGHTVPDDFWIGLHDMDVHDPVKNNTGYGWAEDCQQLMSTSDGWAGWGNGEPQATDTNWCVTVANDTGDWQTSKCGEQHSFLCQRKIKTEIQTPIKARLGQLGWLILLKPDSNKCSYILVDYGPCKYNMASREELKTQDLQDCQRNCESKANSSKPCWSVHYKPYVCYLRYFNGIPVCPQDSATDSGDSYYRQCFSVNFDDSPLLSSGGSNFPEVTCASTTSLTTLNLESTTPGSTQKDWYRLAATSAVDVTESTTRANSAVDATESTTRANSAVDATESTPRANSAVDVTESTTRANSAVDVTESTTRATSAVDVTESTTRASSAVDVTESTTRATSAVDVTESTTRATSALDVTESTTRATSAVDVTESTTRANIAVDVTEGTTRANSAVDVMERTTRATGTVKSISDVHSTTESRQDDPSMTESSDDVKRANESGSDVHNTTESFYDVRNTTESGNDVHSTTKSSNDVRSTSESRNDVYSETRGITDDDLTTKTIPDTQNTIESTTDVNSITTMLDVATDDVTVTSTANVDVTASPTTAPSDTPDPQLSLTAVSPFGKSSTAPTSVATTPKPPFPRNLCGCRCLPLNATSSRDIDEALKAADDVKKELKVDVTTLSSQRRRKESAPDPRPSSTNMGVVGVVLIVTVLAFILLSDLRVVVRHLVF